MEGLYRQSCAPHCPRAHGALEPEVRELGSVVWGPMRFVVGTESEPTPARDTDAVSQADDDIRMATATSGMAIEPADSEARTPERQQTKKTAYFEDVEDLENAENAEEATHLSRTLKNNEQHLLAEDLESREPNVQHMTPSLKAKRAHAVSED